MRVMGCDPGLTRCGLALVETGPGRGVVALDVDVVRTSAGTPLELRLLEVHRTADEWMAVHAPDVVAIERVFAQNQASTAMGTAQAAGVVALAAAARGIPVAALFGGPIRDRIPLYWSHFATYRVRNAAHMGVPPIRSRADVARHAAETAPDGHRYGARLIDNMCSSAFRAGGGPV